ncbi:MAG: pentapeptide repeat-containing protein [Acidimicrobiales bacterium]
MEAVLARAVVAGAWLTGASLGGADLTDADLFATDLTGTRLARADLTGAGLDWVDLTGAEWHPDLPPIWPRGFTPPENAWTDPRLLFPERLEPSN